MPASICSETSCTHRRGCAIDITQIAQELQTLATSGTRMPGFRKKVMVEAERLLTLSEELNNAIPADVREASEILRMKDSILNQAYMEAQRLRNSATEEAAELTSSARQHHESQVAESEILRAAEAKAHEITDAASLEAQQIVQDAQRRAFRILQDAEAAIAARKEGADQYAREVLFNLEEQLAEILGQVRRGMDALRLESERQRQHAGNGSNGGSQVHVG
ncbi:MAG: hypothetical protein L0177_12275 [Chloroflexi bacterium]|nr:hypothetical protein [Chloroflexota bacterium]